MSDMHHFKERLERKIELLKASSEIPEGNKNAILGFINECYAERLSHSRIYKIIYSMITLHRIFGKDFKEATKEDLKELIRKIENHPKNYTENTKKDLRVILKKFYKWYEGGNEEYPEKVKWIKTTEKSNSKKLPEELLTQDEVRKMIQSADNPRDKAMIFCLYESGCRCGELIPMKLKHVQFDKYGAQIVVSGKTGARRVRLIASCDYLRYWLENHPDRENPESYLWVNMSNTSRGSMISYHTLRTRLADIARKAGIKKKVNPHNFRHSRATHLANKLKTAQLCIMFGWQQHSKQPSTYIHLSGEDVDDALLKIHGFKKDEETDLISCPRCHKQYSSLAKYCDACGMPFNIKTFEESQEERDKYDKMMDKLMEEMLKDEAIKKKMEEIVRKSMDRT